MDKQDCQEYAQVYRLLANILVRERSAEEHHMSFVLGDLARRMFLGTEFTPPDEILEEASRVIRTGDNALRGQAAGQLRQHAEHLEQLASNHWDETGGPPPS